MTRNKLVFILTVVSLFLTIPVASISSNSSWLAAFQKTCPKPDWWDTVNSSQVSNAEELWQYGRRLVELNHSYFKTAYQAILIHPEDRMLAMYALGTMPFAAKDYPQVIPMEELFIDYFLQDKEPSISGKLQAEDTIGQVTLDLSKRYNGMKSYEKTIALAERVLSARKEDMNPNFAGVIGMNYQEALRLSGHQSETVDRMRALRPSPQSSRKYLAANPTPLILYSSLPSSPERPKTIYEEAAAEERGLVSVTRIIFYSLIGCLLVGLFFSVSLPALYACLGGLVASTIGLFWIEGRGAAAVFLWLVAGRIINVYGVKFGIRLLEAELLCSLVIFYWGLRMGALYGRSKEALPGRPAGRRWVPRVLAICFLPLTTFTVGAPWYEAYRIKQRQQSFIERYLQQAPSKMSRDIEIHTSPKPDNGGFVLNLKMTGTQAMSVQLSISLSNPSGQSLVSKDLPWDLRSGENEKWLSIACGEALAVGGKQYAVQPVELQVHEDYLLNVTVKPKSVLVDFRPQPVPGLINWDNVNEKLKVSRTYEFPVNFTIPTGSGWIHCQAPTSPNEQQHGDNT